jgi:hypothetical protein
MLNWGILEEHNLTRGSLSPHLGIRKEGTGGREIRHSNRFDIDRRVAACDFVFCPLPQSLVLLSWPGRRQPKPRTRPGCTGRQRVLHSKSDGTEDPACRRHAPATAAVLRDAQDRVDY